MKTLFTALLILLCFSINSFSQKNDAVNIDSIKILQLEEKLQKKVDSLGHENTLLKEYIYSGKKDIKEYIDLGFNTIREDSRRTMSEIQLFLTGFAIIITLIGLVIGFGAKIGVPIYIRNRVNEKVGPEVEKKLIEKLKEKVTKEGIDKIIQEESNKGVEKILAELVEKSKQITEKTEKNYEQGLVNFSNLSSKYKEGILELEQLKNKKKEEFTFEDKEKVKEFSETLTEFKKDEDKYNTYDWFWKGYDAYENKDYKKAIDYYTKTIELKPDDAIAYNNRGVAYYNLLIYNKAIADYKKAIELKPDYADAYNNLGNVHNALKQYDEAIKDWEKAIELEPEHITAHINLVEFFIIKGNYNDAQDYITKAYLLKPDPKHSLILSYLECITLKLTEKNTSDAEKEFEKLLKEEIKLKWSFKEIEDWLEKVDILDDKKKFIRALTEQMKK